MGNNVVYVGIPGADTDINIGNNIGNNIDVKYNTEIEQKVLQTKDMFSQISSNADILEDGKIDIYKRLKFAKLILCKSSPTNLIKVEKFLTDIIRGDTTDYMTKINILEEFQVQNGMMLRKAVEWIYCTAIELYWIVFQNCTATDHKVISGTFLLRNEAPAHIKQGVINNFRQLAFQNINNIFHLTQLADALIHCGEADLAVIGNDLLARLRQLEAKILENKNLNFYQGGNGHMNNGKNLVYNDSQNVHDNNINESAKQAIIILSKDIHDSKFAHNILNKEPLEVIKYVRQIFPALSNKIIKSLDRIAVDHAYFTKNCKLRLRDIFQRVYNRIMNFMEGDMQKEALIRFKNELEEMSGLCSTGHMTRLINVLSGFPDDKGGLNTLKISWESQVSANIYARIQTRLKADESGELITAMISSNLEERKIYTDFLEKIRGEIYDELLAENKPYFDNGTSTGDNFTYEKFESWFNKDYNKRMAV